MRRQWLIGLTVSAVTGVICLLLLEAGLWLAGVQIPEPNNLGDKELGFRGQPADTEMKSHFPEYGDGYLLMRTNNRQFFEDVPTADRKAPGSRRIAVVGDSQTAGGCRNPESYPNVLEQLLTRRDPAHPAEVLNGGVGRYSPYQSLRRAAVDMVPLQPDDLILAIYLGNDLLDMTRTDDRPYLVEQPDGSFQQREPEFIVFADPDNLGNWITRSRTASVVRTAVGPNILYSFSRFRMLLHNVDSPVTQPFRVIRYMNEIRKLSSLDLGFVTQVLNQHHWFQTFPATLPRAKRAHRETIRLAAQTAAQHRMRLTVLLIPAKIQIEPETVEETVRSMQTVDSSFQTSRIQAFLDDYAATVLADCRQMDIPAIDPREPMRQRAAGRELYYRRDMHLNVTGNRVLAEIIAERLTP
jgi:lysophospholipase L1-like esterase